MSFRAIPSAISLVVLAASVNACVASSDSGDPATDDGDEQVNKVEQGVVGCSSSYNWLYRYGLGACYGSYLYKAYRVWVWCDNGGSYAGNWTNNGYSSIAYCGGNYHPQATWMDVIK